MEGRRTAPGVISSASLPRQITRRAGRRGRLKTKQEVIEKIFFIKTLLREYDPAAGCVCAYVYVFVYGVSDWFAVSGEIASRRRRDRPTRRETNGFRMRKRSDRERYEYYINMEACYEYRRVFEKFLVNVVLCGKNGKEENENVTQVIGVFVQTCTHILIIISY